MRWMAVVVPQLAAHRPQRCRLIPIWLRHVVVVAANSLAIALLPTASACKLVALWLNWPRLPGSHPIRALSSIAGRHHRIRASNEINLAGRVLCCRPVIVRNRQQQQQWQLQQLLQLPHRHLPSSAWCRRPAMRTTCRRPAPPAHPLRQRPLRRRFRWLSWCPAALWMHPVRINSRSGVIHIEQNSFSYFGCPTQIQTHLNTHTHIEHNTYICSI